MFSRACSRDARGFFLGQPRAVPSFKHSVVPNTPAVVIDFLHAVSKMGTSFSQSGSSESAKSLQASRVAELKPVHIPAEVTLDPSLKIMLQALPPSQQRSAFMSSRAGFFLGQPRAVPSFKHSVVPKTPAVVMDFLHAVSKMGTSFSQSGSSVLAKSLQASRVAELRPVR